MKISLAQQLRNDRAAFEARIERLATKRSANDKETEQLLAGVKRTDLAEKRYVRAIAELAGRIERIDAVLRDLENPVVEPDPPVVEPDPPVALGMYNNLDYAMDMPVGMLPPAVPAYNIPIREECHAIVTPGGYTLLLAEEVRGHSNPLVAAIRHVRGENILNGRSQGRIIIGIEGDVGHCRLGCGYGPDDKTVISEGLDIVLVGLDDEARAAVAFSGMKELGSVARLHMFNMGLYSTVPDSFVIRANRGIGELIMDGCWYTSQGGKAGSLHASGLHIDQYETLVIANHKFKGCLFREHSVAYIKSAVGDPMNPRHGTWLVGNEIQGGRRTGWQIRPGRGDHVTNGGKEKFAPTTPVVMAFNESSGYGFEHESADGGAAMTVWSSPNQPVYVFGNIIRDARYSCFVAAAQGFSDGWGEHAPWNRDWLNPAGFVIRTLHLFANSFDNPRSSRAAVSITGVQDLFIYKNDIEGQVALVNDFAKRRHDITNGTVHIVRETLGALRLETGDENNPGKSRRLTEAEVAEFVLLD